MKDTIISSCEKSFILNALIEGQRLDGRKLDRYRKLEILLGEDFGCCMVSLGDTKVLCQVTASVLQPKLSRPNEGTLFVNVELSAMAAGHWEAGGRPTEEGTQLTRLMERVIRDSKCVDLESLCIIVDEKVWAIRVDLTILNHDGNLADCCSIAAITSLCHFKRPDVTVDDGALIIHSYQDRDFLPLSVHHIPICVTFAFFNEGHIVLVDPTEMEEKIMEGKLIVGINPYKEVCTLSGSMRLPKKQYLSCVSQAALKVQDISTKIKEALQKDSDDRAAGRPVGFAEAAKTNIILSSRAEELQIQMENVLDEAENMVPGEKEPTMVVKDKGDGVSELRRESESSSSSSSSSSDDSDVETLGVVRPEDKIEQIELEDSEEEETETLEPHHLGIGKRKSTEDARSWYPDRW